MKGAAAHPGRGVPHGGIAGTGAEGGRREQPGLDFPPRLCSKEASVCIHRRLWKEDLVRAGAGVEEKGTGVGDVGRGGKHSFSAPEGGVGLPGVWPWS